MFGGISFKRILASFFVQGPLRKVKARLEPKTRFDEVGHWEGLYDLINIRDMQMNPFVNDIELADYLIVLDAFHKLQAEPGFDQKMIFFATSYQLWAQGGIPNYRKSVARSNGSGDFNSFSFGDQQDLGYMVASPVSSMSPLDTPLCSPRILKPTSRPFFHFGNEDQSEYSPLAYVDSDPMVHNGKATSDDDYGFTGAVPSLLFSSRSNSTVMDPDADTCPLPLPPLGVLLTWHAHLMQPGEYARALDGDYKSLRGVPFPLKEAAYAIRTGALPKELDVFGPETDIDIGYLGITQCALASRIAYQKAFIDSVQRAGYLESGMLEMNPTAGTAAIARYHAFMELLQSKVANGQHLAHTLDIELVWRCHKLDHTLYEEDTAGFADSQWFAMAYRNGRWMDPAMMDKDWFDETSRHWSERYKGQNFIIYKAF